MMKVGLFIFEQADLLDIGGSYEVFLTANRLHERAGKPPLFEIIIISPDGKPVTVFGGLGLSAQSAARDIANLDMVIIPGAIDILAATKDENIQTAAQHLLSLATYKASVCTGAFFLGDAGLLDNIKWTTHFEDVKLLAQRIKSDQGQTHVKWVDNGKIITSGGISSGIAMALHLVEKFSNRELASATARQIEYDWDADTGIITSAPSA